MATDIERNAPVVAHHEIDIAAPLDVVWRLHTDVTVDATGFSGPPVAVTHLRQRVPFGFHGIWIPEGSLG